MALDAARAPFGFYAELNDHLTPGQPYRTVEPDFFVSASMKDKIESFDVPHTEVDLILVNGESSDFSRLVQNGGRVGVYPVFESLDTGRGRIRTCKLWPGRYNAPAASTVTRQPVSAAPPTRQSRRH